MRLSLCNEVLRELPFSEQCAVAAKLGYDGLEIAPFTLSEDPRKLTDRQVEQIRTALANEGLVCTGLHWLLVTPAGLSITDDDGPARRDTIEVITRLCALAGELGASVLVHGSPAQRQLPDDPAQAEQARARAVQAFEVAARGAERAGVVYCIEPLARTETNFLNTVEQASAVVQQINSEHLRTMIDCCAAGNTEASPVPELIREHMPRGLIAHIQLNDPNRKAPGQGDMDFAPIIGALHDTGYTGDLSIEPFTYEPDGPGCAAHAAGYIKGLLETNGQ